MRWTVAGLVLAMGLGGCEQGEGDDDTGVVCDSDGDGYEGAQCDGPDCDDTTVAYHPGQAEVCDGVDTDCDPSTSETGDSDGDGWVPCDGDCNDLDATTPGDLGVDNDGDGLCESWDCDGDGTEEGWDCNDCDPAANENANEIPGDGLDNDCDGSVDEQ